MVIFSAIYNWCYYSMDVVIIGMYLNFKKYQMNQISDITYLKNNKI